MGLDSPKDKNLIFIAFDAIEIMMHPLAGYLGRKLSRKDKKEELQPLRKGKIKPLNPLTMLWHTCNIGVTEDLFNVSLASWKNDWFLDLGATRHLNFRRELFE